MMWLFLLVASDGEPPARQDDARPPAPREPEDPASQAGDEHAAGRAVQDATEGRRGKRPAPAGRAADAPGPSLDAQVAEAQRKLREAIQSNQAERPRRVPQVGQKVDKYFGEKLPPVCERLGCYLTDDGKRFYCVNPTCQKHRKRDTKHTRIAKRPRSGPTYFRCPRCDSRHIDLLMFTSQYECRRCRHTWDKDMPAPAADAAP